MTPTKSELKDFLSLAGFAAFLVAVSFALWYNFSQRNIHSVERVFRSSVGEVQALIIQRMQLYEYGVRGVRGAVASVGFDNLTRTNFLDYAATRDFDHEFPGARGFGVIYRVQATQAAELETKMSGEYGEVKTIKSLGDNNDEKYIIRYVEPYSRNSSAVGLDIASEVNRRAAANFATKSGLAVLTGPITVVQALENKDSAFLLLLPIYEQSNSPDLTNQGQQVSKGWAYAVLVFNEIIQEVAFSANHVAVQLADVTNPGKPEYFFRTKEWEDARDDLVELVEFQVNGRTWQMEVRALPTIQVVPQPYNLPWIGVLLVLVTGSLCLVVYLLLASKQRSVLEQQHQLALTGSIIDASSMGTLLVDSDGRIVRLNRKIKEMFGYSQDELLGQFVELLVPKSLGPTHVVNQQEYDGSYLEIAGLRQVYGLRFDGKAFPIEVTLSSIEVSNQKFQLAGVSDLTERIKFLSQIQESEARWRGLANSLPQLIWTLDANGKVDFLSEQWGGQSTQACDTDTLFHSCVHPDDRNRVGETLALAQQGQTRGQTECRLKRPCDKEYEWYDLQLVAFNDEKGNLVKWIGSNTNISFRKTAETEILALNSGLEQTVQQRTAELRKAQQSLSNILNSVPSMIGYWNRHLSNEFANQSLQDFLHKAREIKLDSGKGSLFEQLFDIHSPYVQTALSGRSTRFEKQVSFGNASPSYFDIHYIPHSIEGKVVGLYVLMQDISEARRAQLDAELASRQKSSFLAVMSHEIRTPLNGILGLAGLLAEKIEDEELKQDAVFLRGNAQTLTVILNDILDISKVESGKLILENFAFNLQEQMDSCCMLHQIPAFEKGIEFKKAYVGFNAQTMVVGDPTRLRQVIHNLLSNAVKFTSKGKVSLNVEYIVLPRNAGRLRIEVADSGIGIPSESQGDIFQPFYQGESSTFRKFGGTGLGLSVSKAIVTAMNGKLWFNSEQGLGTTFFVEVQLEAAASEQLAVGGNSASSLAHPRHVLIVDDMPLNLKVLRKVLEHDQHVVEQANSGLNAFELCEIKKFDLVFLDISMPNLDGYQTAQMIREKSILNKHTPIVALSGHAFDEDIQKALECGMNAHLSKPIEIGRIRQRIFELT